MVSMRGMKMVFKDIIKVMMLSILLTSTAFIHSMENGEEVALFIDHNNVGDGENDNETIMFPKSIIKKFRKLPDGVMDGIVNDAQYLGFTMPSPDVPCFRLRDMTIDTNPLEKKNIEQTLENFFQKTKTKWNAANPATKKILSNSIYHLKISLTILASGSFISNRASTPLSLILLIWS